MRIYLDMPHGCGQDRGACVIANEEVESDRLTTLVKAKLEKLGHTVRRERPLDNWHTEISSCYERAKRANEWGADIFVSVHNNAGGGYGAEAYTYNGEKTKMATRYLQYILEHGGSTHCYTHKDVDEAIHDGNHLIVINQSKMEACLLENFYVDTKSDYEFYKNNIEMFANAIVYGITGIDLKIEPVQIKTYRNIVIYAKGCEADEHIANCFGMFLDDCIVIDHTKYVKGMGKSVYSIGALKGIECDAAIRGKDRRETFEKAMTRIGFEKSIS